MYRLILQHTNRRFILALLLVLLALGNVHGQSRENLVKAGFVEKFTHFVDWPQSHSSEEKVLHVVVVGPVSYAKDLEVLLERTRPGKVRFSFVSGPGQIGPCDLLIISRQMDDQLESVLNQVRTLPVLTISDGGGFCARGVMIQLFLKDEYVRFEVNLSSLTNSGLKMNSLLLRSASKIHER